MTRRAQWHGAALTLRSALRALLLMRADFDAESAALQPAARSGGLLVGLLGAAGALLVQLHLDALALPDAQEIDLWSLSLLGNLALLCVAALLLLTWWLDALPRLLLLAAIAGAMAFWVLAVRFALHLANVTGEAWQHGLPLACWFWWSVALVVLCIRNVNVGWARAGMAFAFVPLVCWPRYELGEEYSDLYLWSDVSPAADVADSPQIETESTYYQQAQLTDDLLRTVKPGVPGVVELYFVGFAGDGSEDVFMKEVSYARDLMRARYGDGHALAMINNPATAETLPLANRHNLAKVLRGVGERMNRDEDILFVYFSSHGSADHQLAVALDAMNLDDLEPLDVENALQLSGVKYRVVGVSACYSGGFLPRVSGPATLAFSAARADRTSFGCGTDRDFTYFGEALFRDQMSKGVDLVAALTAARVAITRRERKEQLTPSEPQVLLGAEIRAQLGRLVSAR